MHPAFSLKASRRRAACAAIATVAVLSPAVWADPPPGYYDTVNTGNATLLRSTLHAVIDDHTRFPYSSAGTDTWNILEIADQDPANAANILDLYRNRSLVKFGGGNGPYNREHTWPNSYGFPDDVGGTNYPYTDCHHLFLCDVGYNSDRANKPFGNCAPGATERVTDVNGGQGGGSGVFPGNSNWFDAAVWQTWNERKGDFARAILYMDVRYEGGTHGVTGAAEPNLIVTDTASLIATTGGNASVAYMGLLSVLVQWNTADPVDTRERTHNDTVFSFQGNRNPFVDHPEWVNALFDPLASDVAGPVRPRTAIMSVHPNPMNPTARVSFALAGPGVARIEVFSADGRFIRTLVDEARPAGTFEVRWNGTDRNGAAAASGPYILRLQSGSTVDTRKVVLLK